MHLSKNDIPIKINVPGAVARQLPDFGVASGAIGAEYFTMSAGTDLAPLLEGLEHNACQSAHWGYMITATLSSPTTTAPPNAAPPATSSTGPPATASASTATPN